MAFVALRLQKRGSGSAEAKKMIAPGNHPASEHGATRSVRRIAETFGAWVEKMAAWLSDG